MSAGDLTIKIYTTTCYEKHVKMIIGRNFGNKIVSNSKIHVHEIHTEIKPISLVTDEESYPTSLKIMPVRFPKLCLSLRRLSHVVHFFTKYCD